MTRVTQSNAASKHIPHLDSQREGGSIDQNDMLEDVLRVTEVTLTNAQILALNTTPIALIAAPGAGKYIIIDEVVGFNDFVTGAFVAAAALAVRYTDGSGDEVVTAFPEVAFVEATADAVAVQHGIDAVPVVNAAVMLTIATSDPTTGAGTMVFQAKYRIVTLP